MKSYPAYKEYNRSYWKNWLFYYIGKYALQPAELTDIKITKWVEDGANKAIYIWAGTCDFQLMWYFDEGRLRRACAASI